MKSVSIKEVYEALGFYPRNEIEDRMWSLFGWQYDDEKASHFINPFGDQRPKDALKEEILEGLKPKFGQVHVGFNYDGSLFVRDPRVTAKDILDAIGVEIQTH